MKIILSKRQYSILIEQSDFMVDRRSNALLNAAGIRNKKDYETVNKVIKNASEIDPHAMNTALQIGTAFIPYVGPFISAGIGLADAAMYYNEGDKKTAGMVAMFSLMPGVGPLISKIPGIKKLGVKGMSALASKLSKSGSSGLSEAEKQVVNGIAANSELVQTELNNLAKTTASKSAVNVSDKTTKAKLLDFAKNGIKFTAPYIGAGYAYDYVYDKANPQSYPGPTGDFSEINVNDVSEINKTAALQIKF